MCHALCWGAPKPPAAAPGEEWALTFTELKGEECLLSLQKAQQAVSYSQAQFLVNSQGSICEVVGALGYISLPLPPQAKQGLMLLLCTW